MLVLLELLEETKQELNVAFDMFGTCASVVEDLKELKVAMRFVALEPVMEEIQDFTLDIQDCFLSGGRRFPHC